MNGGTSKSVRGGLGHVIGVAVGGQGRVTGGRGPETGEGTTARGRVIGGRGHVTEIGKNEKIGETGPGQTKGVAGPNGPDRENAKGGTPTETGERY